MKKTLLATGILAGAFALSSCGKHEEVQEPRIIKECSGLVCSFAIEDDTLQRYTNLLGKSTDRVVKRSQLKGDQDQIEWVIPGGGQLADNSQLMQRGLMPCIGSECSLNSNPTGWVFTSTSPQQVSVSGTIVNPDGSTRQIDKQATVTFEIAPPLVSISRDNPTGDLTYSFTADASDTGIPDDADYTWSVDGVGIGNGKDISYQFENAGQDYEVKLEVTADDMDPIVVTNTITAGAIAPTIAENPEINGKSVTLSVNNTDSALPAGTTYTWSAAGVTAQGLTATLQLPDYGTNYTVTLTATPPNSSASFTATKDITTGYGTPTFGETVVGGSGLDYTFTANNADVGVPDNATFNWFVNGVKIGEGKTIEHIFSDANTQYTIKLETVVDGVSIGSWEKNITTGTVEQPTLNVTPGANQKTFTVQANLDNTVIGDDWTKTWFVGTAPVATGSNTLTNHDFGDFNSEYTVRFVATKGDLTREANTTVTTGFGIPTITPEVIGGSGLDYRLTAETTNTGIPNDATFTWTLADGTQIGTGKQIDHIFTTEGEHTVNLAVSKGTRTTDATLSIQTGAAEQPSLLVTAGSTPKDKTIEADVTNTVIGTDWTKKWFIDGTEVTGQTTGTLTHTFADFGTTYTVRFLATSPDGTLTRENTTTVNTGYGTPTIASAQRAGGDILDYTFTADAASTGLPNDAIFVWSYGAEPVTGNPVDITFPDQNTPFTVNLTVMAADQMTVLASTSKDITTGSIALPSVATSVVSPAGDPRNISLDADLTGTGIDGSWNREWYVDGASIGVGDSITHSFENTNTSYNVTFSATKDGFIDREVTQTVDVPRANQATIEVGDGVDNGTGEDFLITVNFADTGITRPDWEFFVGLPAGATESGFTYSENSATNTISIPYPAGGGSADVAFDVNLVNHSVPGEMQSQRVYVTVGPKPVPVTGDFIITGLPNSFVAPGAPGSWVIIHQGSELGVTCPGGMQPLNLGVPMTWGVLKLGSEYENSSSIANGAAYGEKLSISSGNATASTYNNSLNPQADPGDLHLQTSTWPGRVDLVCVGDIGGPWVPVG